MCRFIDLKALDLQRFAGVDSFFLQEAHNAARNGPLAMMTAQARARPAPPRRVMLLLRETSRPHWHSRPACERVFSPSLRGGSWVLAVSLDGRIAVSAHADGWLRRWDLASGACVGELPAGDLADPRVIAVSADGTRIARANRLHAEVRQFDNGAVLARLSGHEMDIRAIALSADGRTLATGSEDRYVQLCDVGTDTRTGRLAAHEHFVLGLAMNWDGTILVSSSADGTVRVFDLPLRRSAGWRAGQRRTIDAIALTPCGRWLAVVAQHDRRYDEHSTAFYIESEVAVMDTLRLQANTLGPFPGQLDGLSITPDGRYVAFAGGSLSQESSVSNFAVYIACTSPLSLVRTYLGHQRPVRGVALDALAARLVSWDGEEVRVWNTDVHEELPRALGSVPHTLASGHQMIAARHWLAGLAGDGQAVSGPDLESLTCIAVSADLETAAFGHLDGRVVLWRLDGSRGEPFRELNGGTAPVLALALSWNGDLLAEKTALELDRLVVRVRSTTDGSVMSEWQLPSQESRMNFFVSGRDVWGGLAGRLLFIGNDRSIVDWTRDSEDLTDRFRGLRLVEHRDRDYWAEDALEPIASAARNAHGGRLQALAWWEPRLVLTGGGDHTVRAWRVDGGDMAAVLPCKREIVHLFGGAGGHFMGIDEAGDAIRFEVSS